MVHTDPVADESGSETRGYRVTRGLCFFASHEDLQNFVVGNYRARDHAYFPCRDGGCGLRLSLSLPCNGGGSVVR